MPALVEEYIEGREIHAAILGNHPPEVLPLFEMEFEDAGRPTAEEWRPQIISYRAKWDPARRDFYSMDAVRARRGTSTRWSSGHIREVAVGAFQAVRGRDYARVDMRVAGDGQPFILEVNPNPDLVDGAAFAMCAAASEQASRRPSPRSWASPSSGARTGPASSRSRGPLRGCPSPTTRSSTTTTT